MGPRLIRRAFAFVATNAVVVGAFNCSSPYEGAAPEPAPLPERDAEPTDAPAALDASGDAASSACDVTKPFGAPTPLDVVNSTSQERFPRLTADELTLVFGSDRTFGTELVFTATRKSRDAPFGMPEELQRTGGFGNIQGAAPALTGDGLTLFFARAVPDAGGEIFIAVRTKPTDPFGAPTTLAVVNTTQDENAPWVSIDGTELWLESDRAGNTDVFRSVRPPDGGFETPTRADELSSTTLDTGVVLTVDKLTVFFASHRDGGAGNYDVWTATRSAKESTFDQPKNVPELSSTALDVPGWLSPDGCRMYLYSDRAGSRDLYVATRTK